MTIRCTNDVQLYSDTLFYVSEFDTAMTKEAWINLVHENIARWKKINEDQDDLINIIRMINNTTVANKIVTATKDKQSK
jgi:hypothetical protein